MKISAVALTASVVAVATIPVLATAAQAAPVSSSQKSVALYLANPKIKCVPSGPSADYVMQYTCSGFDAATAKGAPMQVQLPDGFYEVTVQNQTTTPYFGNEVLLTPHDAFDAHTGSTVNVAQNQQHTSTYYDAEGDWSLQSSWRVDIASRANDTADQSKVLITVTRSA